MAELMVAVVWASALLLLLSLFLKGSDKRKEPQGIPLASKRFSLFGETFSFIRDPCFFLEKNRAKFGELYIVKLYGTYKIISTTPEAAKHFLVTMNRSFKHGYRPSTQKVSDPEANLPHHDMSLKVRKLLKTPLGPENIHQCIPVYDSLACSFISSWKDGETIDTRREMQRIALKCILNLLWGREDHLLDYDRVFHLESVMNQGFHTTFPVNLPFTTYGKTLRAKEECMLLFREKLAHLRASGIQYDKSVSSVIFSNEEDGLTDAQVCSMMQTLIVAGNRTTASVLVWTFKFLSENPQVLATLKKEHDAISKSREAGANLTWADVQRMQYTQKVIQETMRMASNVKFWSREALEDVEYNGYVVPKGWSLGVTCEFHKDPKFFPDPHSFNPDRFNTPPKPGTFIPFGAGGHMCVGYEFSNSLIPVVIHRVITKFSFERDGPDGVEFWPSYMPKHGFPMKLKLRAEE